MQSHIVALEAWFLKVKQGRQVQKAQNLQNSFMLFQNSFTTVKGPPPLERVVESCVRGTPAETRDWSKTPCNRQPPPARLRRAGHPTVRAQGSQEKSTLEMNTAVWIIPPFSMIKFFKI